MEGKPDWLSGFPVQIYCNRSDAGKKDRIKAPELPWQLTRGRNIEVFGGYLLLRSRGISRLTNPGSDRGDKRAAG